MLFAFRMTNKWGFMPFCKSFAQKPVSAKLKQPQPSKFLLTGLARPSAFTLSEIMITLSIIGVIAVIAVPNIIQAYKRLYVETRLRQAYSIISQMIDFTELENGPANTWNWCLSETDRYEKYIRPYLPKYKYSYISYDYKTVLGSPEKYRNGVKKIKGLNGAVYSAAQSNLLTNSIVITLKNGMDIFIKMGVHGSDSRSIPIWVDINGVNKGNNTVGKEIFVFGYHIKGNDCCSCNGVKRNVRAYLAPGPNDNYMNSSPMPVMTVSNALSSSTWSGCNKSSKSGAAYTTGAFCSYVIYKNNWKIPSNYPVKF